MSRCWWKADEPLEKSCRWKAGEPLENLMGADEPLDNSDGENISGAKILMKLATSKLSKLLDLLKCDKEHA